MDEKSLRHRIRKVLMENVNELIDPPNEADDLPPGMKLSCSCQIVNEPQDDAEVGQDQDVLDGIPGPKNVTPTPKQPAVPPGQIAP